MHGSDHQPPASGSSKADLDQQHQLAVQLCQAGDYARALDLAEQTAQASALLLGPDHPDTLSSRHLVGSALYLQDRNIEAEGVARSVVESRGRTLGPQHPGTLNSKHLHAKILYALDRNAEALPIAYEVASTQAQVLGPDHEDALDSAQLLAFIYLDLGQSAQARLVAAQLHEVCLRRFGPDHEQTRKIDEFLATIGANEVLRPPSRASELRHQRRLPLNWAGILSFVVTVLSATLVGLSWWSTAKATPDQQEGAAIGAAVVYLVSAGGFLLAVLLGVVAVALQRQTRAQGWGIVSLMVSSLFLVYDAAILLSSSSSGATG